MNRIGKSNCYLYSILFILFIHVMMRLWDAALGNSAKWPLGALRRERTHVQLGLLDAPLGPGRRRVSADPTPMLNKSALTMGPGLAYGGEQTISSRWVTT